MEDAVLYTIGFTKKNAEIFFNILKKNKVQTVFDIRLNNVSQLAGFTKRDDLRYFLKTMCDCKYEHKPEWAPTEEILNEYKKNNGSWRDYEVAFSALINRRKIENGVSLGSLAHGCLLCSEPTPEQCHRRLVAEYFKQTIPSLRIVHL